MTESLYSQIADAEQAMRASEDRIGRLRGMREELAAIVGHAEGAGGHVIVECTPQEGLSKLELDPRAMRLPSVDLAATIKTTIAAAYADLQEKVQQQMAGAGAATELPSPEQLRDQLAAAREQFIGGAREAVGGLSDAQRLLNDRNTMR